MGCGDSHIIEKKDNIKNTNEEREEKEKPRIKGKPYKTKPKNQEEDDLIQTIYYGVLADNASFEDCLIKSEAELESNLKRHISKTLYNVVSKKVTSSPTIKYYDNKEDKILNENNLFNFNSNYLIAISGAHLDKVTSNKGVYKVFASENIVASNEYCAVEVIIPKGKPSIWEYSQMSSKHLTSDNFKLELIEAPREEE